jgi:hypothetical protein
MAMVGRHHSRNTVRFDGLKEAKIMEMSRKESGVKLGDRVLHPGRHEILTREEPHAVQRASCLFAALRVDRVLAS